MKNLWLPLLLVLALHWSCAQNAGGGSTSGSSSGAASGSDSSGSSKESGSGSGPASGSDSSKASASGSASGTDSLGSSKGSGSGSGPASGSDSSKASASGSASGTDSSGSSKGSGSGSDPASGSGPSKGSASGSVSGSVSTSQPKLGGYYQPSERFRVGDIKNPCLYDLLFYRYAALRADGTVDQYISLYDDEDYLAFEQLKMQCPGLQTLIVVGGWQFSQVRWSDVAADKSKRKTFVQNATDYMTTNGFSGIQMEWYYPPPQDSDTKNLNTLLKQLKKRMCKKQEGSLLSLVIWGREGPPDSYDLKEISKYVDIIVIYIQNNYWLLDKTELTSPLLGDYSLDQAVTKSLKAGVPADQLAINGEAFGYAYTLADKSNSCIGASAKAAGKPDRYTYTQVQDKLLSNSSCQVYPAVQQAGSYIVCGDQWVGPDLPASVTAKAAYARSKGLAGVFVDSLKEDNPKGDPSFPLSNAAKAGLISN